MPPGPAFNFLCILSSVADILTHAARIRAAQAATRTPGSLITSTERKQPRAATVDVKICKAALTTASNDRASNDETTLRDTGPQKSNLSVFPTIAANDIFAETSKLHLHTFEPVSEISIPDTLKPLDQTTLPLGAKPYEVADAKNISTQEVSSLVDNALQHVRSSRGAKHSS